MAIPVSARDKVRNAFWSVGVANPLEIIHSFYAKHMKEDRFAIPLVGLLEKTLNRVNISPRGR